MVTLSPPPLGGACDRHLVDLCDLRAPEVAKGLKVTTTACQPSGPQSDNHPCAPTTPTCPRRPTRPSASLWHASSCARQPLDPRAPHRGATASAASRRALPTCTALLPFPGRSCFSLVNFLLPLFGLLSGLMGLLACIGSGLLICCCAPKRLEEGSCKFTAVR